MAQKKSMKNAIASSWSQFTVLFRKNSILARRNWKGTLGQLVSPLAIVLMLFGKKHVSQRIIVEKKILQSEFSSSMLSVL
jgi:hypothetical protein